MIELDLVNVHDPEIETVVTSLINYLNTDERMASDIDKFYPEWPEANLGEYENTLSIHTTNATHTHLMPVIEKKEPILNETINVAATYRVGKYDMRLQLDIWCPYKKRRNLLYKKVVDSINYDQINGLSQASGLSLKLENYFDTIARYDIVSYNFPDSERTSQEDDWRAIVILQVHFDKKMQRVVPSIIESIIEDKDNALT